MNRTQKNRNKLRKFIKKRNKELRLQSIIETIDKLNDRIDDE